MASHQNTGSARTYEFMEVSPEPSSMSILFNIQHNLHFLTGPSKRMFCFEPAGGMGQLIISSSEYI